ncbi:MAG: hypothetical protein A2583_07490 [Bdellovibrionales bacterium RIFOXYD1_FULL_53_11]|nr:MAG: hypothetical protein A2583_07490 [Bdellovibrionales bacterium RIFOXYD1_FULL_53_11]
MSKPLKILLSVRDLHPGGVPSLIGPLARGFIKAGLDVVVYNLGRDDEVACPVMDGITIVSGNRINRGGYLGHPMAFRRWIKFVKEFEPDILQSHVGLPDIYASVTPVKAGAIKVRAALAPNLFPMQPYFGWVFERTVTPREWAFDCHVAVSDGVKRSLTGTGIPGSRIHVIWNPVSERIMNAMKKKPDCPGRYQAISDFKGIRLGYLGRFSPEKGPDRIVRWLNSMLPLFQRDVRLYMAGMGLMEPDIRALVSELGLDEKVIMLGYVENPSEILPYMHAMISPSRYEGLPIALLEAACLGCPLAATSTDGALELRGVAKDLFLFPNSEDLAPHIMMDFVKWAESRHIAHENGPNLTPEGLLRVNPANVAAEYIAVYKRLLAASRVNS